MVRARTLTPAERWELGLLMVMLCVACLTLAAIVKQYSAPKDIPKLMAVGTEKLRATPSQNIPLPMKPEQPSLPESANSKIELPISIAMTALPEAPFVVEEPLMIDEPAPAAAAEFKYYAGQKYRYVRTVRLQVTAYAPDARCCWPYDGTTTASGLSVKTNGGKLVAADTSLIPMHSLVSVKGYASGAAVPVLDRGSAIKGHRLDVLLPTFEQAKQWGTRAIDVKVYEPVK